MYSRVKPSEFIEKTDVHVFCGGKPHQGWTDRDGAEADDATEHMDWNAEFLLTLHLDDDVFSVLHQIRAGSRDEKGVQETLHGSMSNS